jgi:hypothetical protein
VNSPESDFGSFVSVTPSQDPLSIFSSGFSPFTPTQSISTHTCDESATEKAAYSATLTFFDKFTADAKRASELNKKDYLEELLLHEDDPLYWLRDELPSLSDSSGENHDDDLADPNPTDGYVNDTSKESERLPDMVSDGFTVMNTDASQESENTQDSEAVRESEPTGQASLPEHAPSPYPSPPMSLPPRPSSALAVFAPSSEPNFPHIIPPLSKSPSSSSLPHDGSRSNSNTLSTFSSRWMSSLLSSSRPATSPNAQERAHSDWTHLPQYPCPQ